MKRALPQKGRKDKRPTIANDNVYEPATAAALPCGMKRALLYKGAPPRKDKRPNIADETAHEHATAVAPVDFPICTVAIFVWGQDPTVLIDALVIGSASSDTGVMRGESAASTGVPWTPTSRAS